MNGSANLLPVSHYCLSPVRVATSVGENSDDIAQWVKQQVIQFHGPKLQLILHSQGFDCSINGLFSRPPNCQSTRHVFPPRSRTPGGCTAAHLFPPYPRPIDLPAPKRRATACPFPSMRPMAAYLGVNYNLLDCFRLHPLRSSTPDQPHSIGRTIFLPVWENDSTFH